MTTVSDLFRHTGVHYGGAVSWGKEVPLEAPGVYVVSTNANANDRVGLSDCPLDLAAVESLFKVRPEATIDGSDASAQRIIDRLKAMWPAGEPVVYVGLATTNTCKRVSEFYGTPIGARAPHAGGWPVQMLDKARLWVHYGPAEAPATAEAAMVERFVEGLAGNVRNALTDPTAPLPFANLAFPKGRPKKHGFRGVKAPKPVSADRTALQVDPAHHPSAQFINAGEDVAVAALSRRTRTLTDNDLAAGQIRIPRESKSLLPESKSRISVEVGGEMHMASWDPRTDGDRERSGILRIGRDVLRRHMSASEPCTVEVTASGYRIF